MKKATRSGSARRRWIAVLLCGSAAAGHAYSSGMAGQVQAVEAPAIQSLIEKAHRFDSQGRIDLAGQIWQQVLLIDPKNREALGGLARLAKSEKEPLKSAMYLDRLRAIDPDDPGIARTAAMKPQPDRGVLLQEAARLASAGQYDRAMQSYRQVYGDQPPNGEIALAFYETEAATEGGRAHAVAGLRGLAEKFPADSRYPVALGRVLTYDPKTRAEGKTLLRRFPDNASANEALRQSLFWDASNPARSAEIHAYLSRHDDAQLAAALRDAPQGRILSSRAAARPQPPEEAAGYAALDARQVAEAERQFQTALRSKPASAGALAGMGYVRMQQANFGGALSYLSQARQNGLHSAGLDAAIATCRFWLTMADGADAVRREDLRAAEVQYRLALAMRPASPEAMEGLGGTLLKAQQYRPAEQEFFSLLKIAPNQPRAWRGLFLAQCGEGNEGAAVDTERRMPDRVRGTLMQDPLYLRALAAAYVATGREPDAVRVLQIGLDLPFPADARDLGVDTKMQYAALLEAANRLTPARGLYRQVLAADGNNLDAWKGTVRVQYALDGAEGHDAIGVLGRVPGPVFGRAMNDPGFEQTVASIYAREGQYDRAQDLLIRVMTDQSSGNGRVAVAARMQLAGLYVQRKNPAQAYVLYRQVLVESPQRLDAMKGLLATLHAAGRNQQAIDEARQMDPSMRTQLERDIEYLQTLAAIYTDEHQPGQAQIYLARVLDIYSIERTSPPPEVQIESAWLLYNTMDDAGLYRQLMALGGRRTLTDAQKRTVQTIWIDWAVRRANQAVAAGHRDRARTILDTTVATFPEVPGATRTLAGGYARAGETRKALKLWKSEDLSDAAAGDYRAAAGAALAEGDEHSAETWVRAGLSRYAHDPELLMLAARMDESHGDTRGAIAYYRASLDAMPAGVGGAPVGVGLGSVYGLPGGGGSEELPRLLRPDMLQESGTRYLPSYETRGDERVPAVPNYMANPSTAPASRQPSARPSLRDYVPQASAGERVPADGTEVPSFQRKQVGTARAVFTPAMYQQSAITAQTNKAASEPQATPRLTIEPGVLSANREVPERHEEVFGPFVPYVKPAVNVSLEVSPAAAGTIRRPDIEQEAFAGQSVPPADLAGGTSAPDVASKPGKPQLPPPETRSPTQIFGQQYPQPGTGSLPSAGVQTGRRAVARKPAAPVVEAPPEKPSEPLGPAVGSITGTGTRRESEIERLGPLPENTARLDGLTTGDLLPVPLSGREQAQLALASLEGSYSGWVGGTASGRYRTGGVGLDRLTDIETSAEASAMLGNRLRLTVVPTAVFLDPGTVDPGTYTGTGTVLGTLPLESLTAPRSRSVAGFGGELQVATRRYSAALGYTPYEFPVRNIDGRFEVRATRHLTFYGDRSAVNETLLSYAGIRDPGTATSTFPGNTWGGVVSTGGGIRVDAGNDRVGFYATGDGAALTGYHVLRNNKFEGLLGAYFLAHRWPEYGRLTVGTSIFGMHYANNQSGLTYGRGGYFSPNDYVLATVPVTWDGRYRSKFHYRVTGSLGVQTFKEATASFYPLDPLLQATYTSPAIAAACTLGGPASQTAACNQYPANSNTGFNYGLDGEASYLMARHWYFGGFLTANNTNNYKTVVGGFFVRYTFRPQYTVDEYPTGLFPITGTRAFRIP